MLDVFIRGIMSFFLIGENPIRTYMRRKAMQSDEDRIRGDWYKIGNDIRKSCEEYKSARA